MPKVEGEKDGLGIMCDAPNIECTAILACFVGFEEGRHSVEKGETYPGSSWSFHEKFSEERIEV